jgi:hypothetical protein
MRSDIAREGFLDKISASKDQEVRFDVLMNAMNVRIEHAIGQWAEVFEQEEMPPHEAAIRMMNDVTGSLVITYDELDRSMPRGWRRDAGDSFELIDFIDPYVASPLVGLEDKLDFE